MNRKQEKINYVYQTWLVFVLVTCLAFYYFFTISSPTYIGISVTKKADQWQINKIKNDGTADQTGLLAGDRIVKVDGKLPENQASVKKWLIIEQAKEVTVERGGQKISYTFIENQLNLQRYFEFLMLVIVMLIFLRWYSQRQIISRRSSYFYYFVVSVILTLLAIVPSSTGNTVARCILILMISFFPLFICVFSYRTYIIKEQLNRNKTALFCLAILLINSILLLGNLMFDMPIQVIQYLNSGIFYMLFVSLLVISLGHVLKKDNKSSDANLVLLSLLSTLPFLFCYMLQLGWAAPFSVVIPFLILPIMALFHRLTLSKSFIFRYRLPYQVFYLIITASTTLVIILLILLSHYVPLYIVGIYGFLLTYALLSIIIEMLSLIRRDKRTNDDLTAFLVAEEEREKISLHIHDTLIQDIVYFIRKLKEKEAVSTTDPEAIEILEETIYLLRELCTDVYPLMIQELGLKSALANMASQLQKKYPVLITLKIEVIDLQLSEKVSNFVLRSVKELMINSILHGQAKGITLSVTEDDHAYRFSIVDDGCFIVKEKMVRTDNHFGIDKIKEKLKLLNGTIAIETANGTCIWFTIPEMKETSK
ncbi:sensor histidine kinase [Lactococcus carnosus]|uniref:PDZ domain-containing protein n=1 Tax=Pseudolactococcus carnosus TaxID=2749961 RepID=A0ABT0AQN1_9LACT|nr:ATP-binding protein [Lactococcus carnosus]MCJ1988941.1 PDZ domain-containing protein [Lactococcus carnosus]